MPRGQLPRETTAHLSNFKSNLNGMKSKVSLLSQCNLTSHNASSDIDGAVAQDRFIIADYSTVHAEVRGDKRLGQAILKIFVVVCRVFLDQCLEIHNEGKLDGHMASMAKYWATRQQTLKIRLLHIYEKIVLNYLFDMNQVWSQQESEGV